MNWLGSGTEGAALLQVIYGTAAVAPEINGDLSSLLSWIAEIRQKVDWEWNEEAAISQWVTK